MEHNDNGAIKYHLDDIEELDANNSHSFILKFIENSKLVLDVGSSTGFLGKALRKRNIRAVGVEFDSAAAEKTKPFYDKVIVGDVTLQDVLNQIENKAFDAVVLGDVVEHLTDPWSFVKEIAKKITDNGDLIISIPNLGHASVIASLLSGSFQYRDMGI